MTETVDGVSRSMEAPRYAESTLSYVGIIRV